MVDPVKITPKAIEEIKLILEKKDIPSDYCLRLLVKGGHGCAGVNFGIGFDKLKDTDMSYVVDGITVLIQKPELMFLMGKMLDFYDGADARGFVFHTQEESSTTAL